MRKVAEEREEKAGATGREALYLYPFRVRSYCAFDA
jgi:hypothetical protein